MLAGDEVVAVYDAAGRVTGAAPRGEVYRRGLWHAATGVLVRSGDGERVVLHRRTADKLVFAYNTGGVMTYITLDLDGSDTTLTHGTSAP